MGFELRRTFYRCRNLPFGGRATRDSRDACSMKGICTESPPMFIWGKRRKNRKRRDLRTFKWKGSGVVFTYGEGISTPHVRPKERQPLIECANMTLIFYVPFLCLYILYTLFIFFFSFCGRQGCFPLLLRIPQLRWGNQTYVVLSYQVILFLLKRWSF